MRHIVLGVLTLLVLLPAAWALDDTKDKKPDKKATPAEEYRALVKEFLDKEQEVYKAFQAAKTTEEKNKAFASRPKPQEYTGKILKLAQDHPKEAFVPEALTWVVRYGGMTADGKKALNLLLADHLESQEMGHVCQLLRRASLPDAEKHLRTILEKNPHKDVQGNACLVLGQYLKDRKDRPGLTDDVREKMAKEAETLLERTAEQYGDVKLGKQTLGEIAKTELFEVRHLSIGKQPPEIEAEDIDGKKFKLSDYRGKVVVLDFWGNW